MDQCAYCFVAGFGVALHRGGLHFIADTLAWAERNYAFAAKAHLSDQLTQNISELGDKFAGTYLTSAALTAAAWLPSLLLAPFLAFFFLRDGWRFKMFLSRAVPNAFLSARSICSIRSTIRPGSIFRV